MAFSLCFLSDLVANEGGVVCDETGDAYCTCFHEEDDSPERGWTMGWTKESGGREEGRRGDEGGDEMVR